MTWWIHIWNIHVFPLMVAHRRICSYVLYTHTHTHNHFTALFPDHPGEPLPEENFWTLWCKGRLTEADTPTIRLGATPSGLSSAHLHHPPCFLQAGCPSCYQTNSVNAIDIYYLHWHWHCQIYFANVLFWQRRVENIYHEGKINALRYAHQSIKSC